MIAETQGANGVIFSADGSAQGDPVGIGVTSSSFIFHPTIGTTEPGATFKALIEVDS